MRSEESMIKHHAVQEDSLFSLDPAHSRPPEAPSAAVLPALAAVDWEKTYDRLDHDGFAVTPRLLTHHQCEELVSTFDAPGLFRSTVVMQRHGFGIGTYKYFADLALVPLVQSLRELLYPPMAWMANCWAARLGEPFFPETLPEFLDRCAHNGQSRPTPLILRYGPGGYACLHQDVYGDIVFPLQMAIVLNEPGEDFTAGENVFVEQRPRSQSRAMVARPLRGQGLIFPVRHRPVMDGGGIRRYAMRHGTNAVESGRRNVLGIIFHNAR
jgi:uncharacterized protein